MYRSLVLLCFCAALSIRAQVLDPTSNFVVLLDGSELHGETFKIGHRKGAYGLQVQLDDQVFSVDRIRAFQTQGQYYAHLSQVKPGLKGKFAFRAFTGKLDLYQYRKTTLLIMSPVAAPIPSALHYYAKDGGPVKRMTRPNLFIDLADDPNAMVNLRRSRTLVHTGVGMALGGIIVAMIGGSQSSARSDEPQNPMVAIGAAIGLGCAIPFYLSVEEKRQAVRKYTGFLF